MLFQFCLSTSGGVFFSSAIWLRVRPVSGQPPPFLPPCLPPLCAPACCRACEGGRAPAGAAACSQVHASGVEQPQGSACVASPAACRSSSSAACRGGNHHGEQGLGRV